MGNGSLGHKIYGGLQMIRVCKDWPKWFREYAGGPADDRAECYRMRAGAQLHTRRNRSDLHMIDEIWAFRKYDYFGHQVQAGDVVVDIGANIGTFTVYAAASRRAARIISFEPFPANFAMLKRNVEANKLGIVTCVNEAVGGTRGRLPFRIDAEDQGSHGLTDDRSGNVIEVQCCTLEDVFQRYSLDKVDYLKMDCEGAEYEIFMGAPSSLLQRIGRISMEYHRHPKYGPKDLEAVLQKQGFATRCFGDHRLYARRSG